MLIAGLFFIVVASLIKLNYKISASENREQYYAGVILCLAANMIIDVAALSVLAQAIPPRLKQGFWNAGVFKSAAESLGRAIGSAMFTAYAWKSIENHTFTAQIVALALGVIFLVMTIIFRKRLRAHNEVRVAVGNSLMNKMAH